MRASCQGPKMQLGGHRRVAIGTLKLVISSSGEVCQNCDQSLSDQSLSEDYLYWIPLIFKSFFFFFLLERKIVGFFLESSNDLWSILKRQEEKAATGATVGQETSQSLITEGMGIGKVS